MSTIAPMRNPSRMPFFTQPLTRQPVLARGVGLGRADGAGVQRCLELLQRDGSALRCIRPACCRRAASICCTKHFSKPQVFEQSGEFWLRSLSARARTSAAARPAQAGPSSPSRLYGIGFDSMKITSISGTRRAGMRHVEFVSASRASFPSGTTFDATEMTPLPPTPSDRGGDGCRRRRARVRFGA